MLTDGQLYIYIYFYDDMYMVRSLQDVLVPDVVFYISGEACFCLSTITCPPNLGHFTNAYQGGMFPKMARGRVRNWTWISVAVFDTFCLSFGIGMHYSIIIHTKSIMVRGLYFVLFCTTMRLVAFLFESAVIMLLFVSRWKSCKYLLGFRIHTSCLKWWRHMMTYIYILHI